MSAPARVLVVGASRGLGLGFVEHYLAQGSSVTATVRDDASEARLSAQGVIVQRLDLLDPQSLDQAAQEFASKQFSLVILNAGVTGPRGVDLSAGCDRAQFDRVMQTNVHAALALATPLIEALSAERGTLAFLTSRMGSIAGAASSGSALYRVSKAAENMVARLAHLDAVRHQVRVLALHPGWVRTDMGGQGADIDVGTSISGMARVLADAARHPSGGFYDYRGESIEW